MPTTCQRCNATRRTARQPEASSGGPSTPFVHQRSSQRSMLRDRGQHVIHQAQQRAQPQKRARQETHRPRRNQHTANCSTLLRPPHTLSSRARRLATAACACAHCGVPKRRAARTRTRTASCCNDAKTRQPTNQRLFRAPAAAARRHRRSVPRMKRIRRLYLQEGNCCPALGC